MIKPWIVGVLLGIGLAVGQFATEAGHPPSAWFPSVCGGQDRPKTP